MGCAFKDHWYLEHLVEKAIAGRDDAPARPTLDDLIGRVGDLTKDIKTWEEAVDIMRDLEPDRPSWGSGVLPAWQALHSSLSGIRKQHLGSDRERESFWEEREMETTEQLVRWREREYRWEAKAKAWKDRDKVWTEREATWTRQRTQWEAERERLEKATRGADLRREALDSKLADAKDRLRKRDDTISALRCKLALAEAGARRHGDVTASAFARYQEERRAELREMQERIAEADAKAESCRRSYGRVLGQLADEQKKLETMTNLEERSRKEAQSSQLRHEGEISELVKEREGLSEKLQDTEERKRLFLGQWMESDVKAKRLEAEVCRKTDQLRASQMESRHLKVALAKCLTPSQLSRSVPTSAIAPTSRLGERATSLSLTFSPDLADTRPTVRPSAGTNALKRKAEETDGARKRPRLAQEIMQELQTSSMVQMGAKAYVTKDNMGFSFP